MLKQVTKQDMVNNHKSLHALLLLSLDNPVNHNLLFHLQLQLQSSGVQHTTMVVHQFNNTKSIWI